jgi:tripartite-type tricarboxylate transporter receptor subunit TctC
MQKVPYDPVKDFYPITLAMSFPNLLVVHPSLAMSSARDVIAFAKAKPGELNFATGASGSNSHISMELFRSMAGVNIQRIPFKGEGPATIGLLGGEVQLMFASASAVSAHTKSGKLRVLGVSSAQPSAVAPGVPTISASGLPGFESVTVVGIHAPAKTPAVIVERLNREMTEILHSEAIKERFLNTGAEAVGSSPNEFSAMIKSDMEKLGRVIRNAGIRTE